MGWELRLLLAGIGRNNESSVWKKSERRTFVVYNREQAERKSRTRGMGDSETALFTGNGLLTLAGLRAARYRRRITERFKPALMHTTDYIRSLVEVQRWL
ncbi:hypothetical protein M5K25_022793 [Dendrobium thyrsiflorum]|uniref:Uncharacterized protein n=1 Tax=Dendrobium thyrsiflorum TaxID=117978 RepID=A0ABD0U6Y9_DENTH